MNKKFISLIFIAAIFNPLFADKIIFSAGNMSGQSGKKSSKTVLSGNAYIKTDTMEIYADTVELSGDDYNDIKATGHVSGKNFESKMEFTCETLEFNRKTKIALLKGSVDLVDVENSVKAKAQMIEYNQDSETAILQIQINLVQKDNVCTGSYAVYQKKNQMLEISGNAQVKQGDDTFRAQQISLNLKTQEITLSGNVKGAVKAENKSEPKEQPLETENHEVKEDTLETEEQTVVEKSGEKGSSALPIKKNKTDEEKEDHSEIIEEEKTVLEETESKQE